VRADVRAPAAATTSTSRTAAELSDRHLLRRTGRVTAVQAGLGIGLVLLLVGVLAYVGADRVQRREADRQLAVVVARADDVGDPPPGVALALAPRGEPVAASPGAPAVARAVLRGPTGYRTVVEQGVPYRALVAVRPNRTRVAALLDLRPQEALERQLLGALLVAELAGLVGAAVVVGLLSRRAIRPLAAALALQRRFVADASHELRTPLTVLHTRAQVLAARLEGSGADAALQRHAQGIVADTRALGETVQDLLLTAELESDPAARVPLDLVALAEQVQGSFSDAARARGVDLRVVADERPLLVEGAPAALRRAVSALVDNALGHERAGGRVLLRLERTGEDVHLTVADTGVGLDPATAEGLFERFTRGRSAPSSARRFGIGLGLAREVVHAHGGEVLVDGEPGRGAAFTVALPAARPRAADAASS
jgi:signal transduction histidine kinase